MMRTWEKWAVACILVLHGSLLAWSAIRHSPVIDEVGHLVAGVSHWKLQRFDLYCVNPPLIRVVATLPLVPKNLQIDLTGYQTLPRNRREFIIGSKWITAQQNTFLSQYTIARWASILFSVLGAMVCMMWGRDLHGPNAGLTALCLWCFCPNVLGHASLMTPDAGAAAVGVAACYVFRKWLRWRTMKWALIAGTFLGLTLLTKFTWIFLLALWPLIWLVFRWSNAEYRRNSFKTELGQMIALLMTSIWTLNNGYLFEDTLKPLGNFEFSSKSLAGESPDRNIGESGNRFRGMMIGNLPMPVPRNYIQGIDHLKYEYEYGYRSYLRGVKRLGGWWYYYLYAMLVKMPVGTLLLIGVAVVQFVVNHRGHGDHRRSTEVMNEASDSGITSKTVAPCDFTLWSSVTSVVISAIRRTRISVQSAVNRTRRADAQPLSAEVGSQWFETLYLLAPAMGILWLVSSQTGFNHHLRYVLPAFPFLFIYASRTALLFNSQWRLLRLLPVVCVTGTIVSSLSVYPHSLSYFNELSGGSINGWKHLDSSNIDWGQDLILVKEWVEQHPEAKPLHIHSTGYVTPEQMGIATQPLHMTTQISPDGKSLSGEFAPGWYIVGLTRLVDPQDPFHELLKREPDGYIGYSMRIYHVTPCAYVQPSPVFNAN